VDARRRRLDRKVIEPLGDLLPASRAQPLRASKGYIRTQVWKNRTRIQTMAAWKEAKMKAK
jgi:hypothetical protein